MPWCTRIAVETALQWGRISSRLERFVDPLPDFGIELVDAAHGVGRGRVHCGEEHIWQRRRLAGVVQAEAEVRARGVLQRHARERAVAAEHVAHERAHLVDAERPLATRRDARTLRVLVTEHLRCTRIRMSHAYAGTAAICTELSVQTQRSDDI
eukprot:498579-Pleurochrysis_carterae.AAC.1